MLSTLKSGKICLQALERQAQEQAKISDETVHFHRLNALLLVSDGMSCRSVAELYGINVRTVQRWVVNYQASGIEGLKDQQKDGRPPTISEQQWKLLKKDFAEGPVACGVATEPVSRRKSNPLEEHLTQKKGRSTYARMRGRALRWDVYRLAEHLGKKHGITFSIRQYQRLLNQLRKECRPTSF